MKYNIICASSDLGLELVGDKFGPDKLIKVINKKNIDEIAEFTEEKCKKSHDKKDLKKNINEINIYNEKIFNKTKENIENNHFPIMLGGDHSIAIATALASNSENKNIGIIWIDAHADFNTFETTTTGNIHGMPFATICGYKCEELRKFATNTINPKNAVLIGGRAIDIPDEMNNLIDAGITIISEDEVHQNGVNATMKKAFEIARKNTNGIHISYDLDGIDPHFAPGVSTREDISFSRSLTSNVNNKNTKGFTKEEAIDFALYIKNNLNSIKSFDLVEFNPLNDIDDKTINIAKDIIDTITD